MASGEGANARPPACIHVDLDSVWAMAMSFGLDIDIDPDPILHSSIDNFLDIFERHRIKATFFITGKDAANKSNTRLVAEILNAGHEIANHSMNHKPNFTKLDRREIEAEIAGSTQAIENATGQKCMGFRAPTYNVNGFILRLLQEDGYAYDTSILPTFMSPVLGIFTAISCKKSLAYGQIHHAMAPLVPYHPDERKTWKRGSMEIVEVPITTMPFLRLPFHCSYVFQTGLPLFRLGVSLTSLAGAPLVYLFHARELAECAGDWASEFPFKDIAFSRRKAIYEAILKTISEKFNVITTMKLIKGITGESSQSAWGKENVSKKIYA